jgi:hypothetical protein
MAVSSPPGKENTDKAYSAADRDVDQQRAMVGLNRAHLAEHLLQLGWQEGLVFGVSPVSPFVIPRSSIKLTAHGRRRTSTA